MKGQNYEADVGESIPPFGDIIGDYVVWLTPINTCCYWSPIARLIED
jgi:hypothetical protein